jgi:uncharacterized membrane protein YGL010W
MIHSSNGDVAGSLAHSPTLLFSCALGIWQILLDFSGGVLSDLQLVFDCLDMGHWAGITGNLAKLSLGLVSICFDTVFMLQHYVWYGNLRLSADVPDEFADATSEEVSSFV